MEAMFDFMHFQSVYLVPYSAKLLGLTAETTQHVQSRKCPTWLTFYLHHLVATAHRVPSATAAPDTKHDGGQASTP